jgi:TIR domain/Sulfatase-modifying factor enzyme 1
LVDVFISYSRATRAKVEPIKHKLDALGLDCFFDLHQIDGGANFPDVIDRALRDSKAVLCCWSPQYFKGQWSMIECRDAVARRNIVPVAVERFEQFAPPADLRQINWFDLVEWQGDDDHEDWNRTLLNLGKLVGRELGRPLQSLAGGAAPSQSKAPVAPPDVQARAAVLEDLRTTWSAFRSKSDIGAVEKFLEHVRAVVTGSGFEFEIEQHLDDLREAARRRAENAQRAEIERQKHQAAADEARRLAAQARLQPGAVWRDVIPGMPEDTVPEMLTIPLEQPSLALSRHPVTFADLDAAIAVGADLDWPPDHGKGRDRHPVVNVSWDDAKAYLAWLNGRLGLTGRADAYRLPSEAEWTHARGAGELWEWCEDSWGDGDASMRVLRSAAATDAGEKAREGLKADTRRGDIGFRLARRLCDY